MWRRRGSVSPFVKLLFANKNWIGCSRNINASKITRYMVYEKEWVFLTLQANTFLWFSRAEQSTRKSKLGETPTHRYFTCKACGGWALKREDYNCEHFFWRHSAKMLHPRKFPAIVTVSNSTYTYLYIQFGWSKLPGWSAVGTVTLVDIWGDEYHVNYQSTLIIRGLNNYISNKANKGQRLQLNLWSLLSS